jgi:hypothetical protein
MHEVRVRSPNTLRTVTRGVSVFVTIVALFGGCSTDDATKAPEISTLEQGFCSDSCAQPCEADKDCDTAAGELCCDLGSDGKACTDAAACPRQCTSDERCDQTNGEACLRVTLESSSLVCTAPARSIQLCDGDGDCKTEGDVCCQAYNEPLCLPGKRCPRTCQASSDCNTQLGEICCTSLPILDRTLKSGGICTTPRLQACPTACQQSSDCNTKAGELCCNGLCDTACQQECSSSNECTGQICCKTLAMHSALLNGGRRPGYDVPTNGSTNDPEPDDSSGDVCLERGFYGDGTCDAFCALPDPDCLDTLNSDVLMARCIALITRLNASDCGYTLDASGECGHTMQLVMISGCVVHWERAMSCAESVDGVDVCNSALCQNESAPLLGCIDGYCATNECP